jgi:hypothetical protein
MRSLIRRGARCLGIALAAGLGAWDVVEIPCRAGDGPAPVPAPPGATWCPRCQKSFVGPHGHPGPGAGTLGYGKPGVYPGFQGFGLGYHPGYGYGRGALGVGAEGGYPFYGGPGYPHPWPTLRRLGPEQPFAYYGGPGGPTPEHPKVFGPIGPLAPDNPVVKVELEPGVPVLDYGCFTGVVPYPESTFAPYASVAVGGGSSIGVSPASPPNTPPNMTPAPGEQPEGVPPRPPGVAPPAGVPPAPPLGIDAGPSVDAGGVRGLKVARVYPGGAGEKAGLRDGDVIRSANGYVTEGPGNLAWIIANAAPDKVLRMSVRSASDGRVRTVTVPQP